MQKHGFSDKYWESFKKTVFYTFCGLVRFFLIMPNFIVVPISFSGARFLEFPPKSYSWQWYNNYFETEEWVSATITSFEVAILVTICATVLGSLTAYGLVRGRFPGKNLINSFIISPMVTPVLVTAVAVYKIYSDLGLTGTLIGFTLAHTIMALPFVVIVMTANLRGINVEVEQAARSLGANRITTLRRVVLPLALPGMIAGGLFAFLISFDELIIALFISSPTLSTLPKKLWDGLRTEINPTIAAVSTLLVILSVIILVAAGLARRYFEKKTQ